MFQLGDEYLSHYCGAFTMDRQIYLELPEFWIWFRQVVKQADKERYLHLTIEFINAQEHSGASLKDLYYRMINSHQSLFLTPNRIVNDAYEVKYKAIKHLIPADLTLNQSTQLTQLI